MGVEMVRGGGRVIQFSATPTAITHSGRDSSVLCHPELAEGSQPSTKNRRSFDSAAAPLRMTASEYRLGFRT